MPTFLEVGIEERNEGKIRSGLGTAIMADPLDRKGEVKRTLNSIEGNGLEIWAIHDNGLFELDKNLWNKDYFIEVQAELKSNFSKERFYHLIDVAKHVYKDEQQKDFIQISQRTRGKSPTKTSTSSIGGKGLLVAGGVTIAIFVITKLLGK